MTFIWETLLVIWTTVTSVYFSWSRLKCFDSSLDRPFIRFFSLLLPTFSLFRQDKRACDFSLEVFSHHFQNYVYDYADECQNHSLLLEQDCYHRLLKIAHCQDTPICVYISGVPSTSLIFIHYAHQAFVLFMFNLKVAQGRTGQGWDISRQC